MGIEMKDIIRPYLIFALVAVLFAVFISFMYLHYGDHSTYYSYIGNVSITNKTSDTASTYSVMVAMTPMQWRRGLMYRSNISGTDGVDGMLFVFGSYGNVCMWMKNTYTPLQIDWISNHTVTHIEEASPLDLTQVCHYGDSVLEVYPNSTIYPGDKVLQVGT